MYSKIRGRKGRWRDGVKMRSAVEVDVMRSERQGLEAPFIGIAEREGSGIRRQTSHLLDERPTLTHSPEFVAQIYNNTILLGVYHDDRSIKFYPLPPQQITPRQPKNSPPSIRPRNNSNRPLLPFPIPNSLRISHHPPQVNTSATGERGRRRNTPIERNRHRAQPGPHHRPHRPPPHLIKRQTSPRDLPPHAGIDPVDVEEGERAQKSHVRCAEEVVPEVGGERGAEEDEDEGQQRGGEEEGEEEGEEGGLRGREKGC